MLSRSTEDTTKIAKAFLGKILKKNFSQQGALVVCLSGDLGVGKTTFVQAIGRHLLIKSKIGSPTFVIIKNYILNIKDYKKFFHIDAYRLKNEQELLRLGWGDIIGNKNHLVFIEWPENVSKVIPSDSKFVYISHTKDGHRDFKLVI